MKAPAGGITRFTPIDELPQLLSVEEFCVVVGISRSTAYDLVRRNELECVKFGRVVRIPRTVVAVKRAGGTS